MTPVTEFVVGGIPKAPGSNKTSRQRTRDWQSRVRDEAQQVIASVPDATFPVATPISVVIVYFHRDEGSGVDVDNMAKPILDALEGILFVDDARVSQLTARRTELKADLTIRNVTPALADGLALYDNFVLVRLAPPPDHGLIP